MVILSIGLTSNLDNQLHYFERESSNSEDGYKMVANFLDKLLELAETFQQTLPTEIDTELESLQEIFKILILLLISTIFEIFESFMKKTVPGKKSRPCSLEKVS